MAHSVPPAVRITFSVCFRRLHGEFVIFFTNSIVYFIRNKTGKMSRHDRNIVDSPNNALWRDSSIFVDTLLWGGGSKCVVWNKTHVGEDQTHRNGTALKMVQLRPPIHLLHRIYQLD